jgi:hypothetical protein
MEYEASGYSILNEGVESFDKRMECCIFGRKVATV